MSYSYPRLRDYFALSNQHETISQELHRIQSAVPYAIDLFQIPQVQAGIATILENVWVDATEANTLLTIEIETSPSTWQAATIVASSTPAALQVYLQISTTGTFPYSPRLIFHSSHAGQQVRVSYEGWGSAPLARHATELYNVIDTIQSALPPRLVNTTLYNGGRMDGGGAPDTAGYILPSLMRLPANGIVAWSTFDGVAAEFGTGGNCEVATFTNASYWKRVVVSITYNGSAWSVGTMESAEAATQGALTFPAINGYRILCGYADCQNNGTISGPGEVNSDIDMVAMTFVPEPVSGIETFEYYGTVLPSEPIGVAFAPGIACQIDKIVAFIDDSGSAGSTIVDALLCDSVTPNGVTMLDGSKITMASSSGTPVTTTVAGTAMVTQTVDADEWVRVVVTTTVATGAQHIKVALHYRGFPA